MIGDLGVKTLDEVVNKLLQEMQDVPLPMFASATNYLESGASTWSKEIIHSVKGLCSVYKRIYKVWNEIASGSSTAATLAGTAAHTSSPPADGIYANRWY